MEGEDRMRNKKRWLAMMLAAAMAFTAPGTSLMGTVSVYAADVGSTNSPVEYSSLGSTTTIQVGDKIYLQGTDSYTLQSTGIVSIKKESTYTVIEALKPGAVAIKPSAVTDTNAQKKIVVELKTPGAPSFSPVADDKSIVIENAEGMVFGISETDDADDSKINYSYSPDNEAKVTISGLMEGKTYYVWGKLVAVKDVSAESPYKKESVTTKKNITGKVVFAPIADETYTGVAKTPTPSVVVNGVSLSSGDFDYSYENNTNVGTATVKVTGKGNYCGTASTTFKITKGIQTPPAISTALNGTVRTASANSYKIEKANSKYQFALRPATLSTVIAESEWKSVTKVAGINTVEFTGLSKDTQYKLYARLKANANQEASPASTDFESITTSKASIADATVIVAAEPAGGYVYNSVAIEPPVTKVSIGDTVLTKTQTGTDKDYKVEYENNTDVGTASIIVTGLNDYAGTKKVINFKISPMSVSDFAIGLSNTSLQYTGQDVKPTVSILGLKESDDNGKSGDFTVKYENNLNVGKAKVTVTGVNNYTGTVSKEYNVIQQTPSAPANVVVETKADGNPDKTMDSITIKALKPAANGPAYQYEYAISEESGITDATKLTWQSGTTFTGLKAGTAYTVYARIKADTSAAKNWAESPMNSGAPIST